MQQNVVPISSQYLIFEFGKKEKRKKNKKCHVYNFKAEGFGFLLLGLFP